MLLSVERLHAGYGLTSVLRDINLDARAGEAVAVIGPNGEDLQVDIQMEGIEAELAAYIARCLRQIYGVDSVLTSTKTAG